MWTKVSEELTASIMTSDCWSLHLLWPRLVVCFPLWTLYLGLKIIIVHPRFVSCYHVLEEIWIWSHTITQFQRNRQTMLLLFGGQNALTRFMFKTFVKMCWTEPNEMLRSSAVSRMVNLLFEQIISFTFEMFLSVHEVKGCPCLSLSSIDSEPLRNHSNHL
jgi:hypothetical protein